MKRIFLLSMTLAISLFSTAQEQPRPKKVPKVFKEHGGERVDPYYWLSDPANPEVISHLKSENAYVEAYMKKTDKLQKELYDEIVARIPQRDQSLPTKENGYWYYSRFEEGQQYPFYLRKKGSMNAPEEMLIDAPAMAKPYKIFLIRGSSVSPDNKKIALGIDTSGDRRVMLHLKDLTTGKVGPLLISNTTGNYVWANDNKSLYYGLNDHTVRAYRIMHHVIGTDPSTDKEIYVERDSTFSVYLSKSKTNKYIFITSYSTDVTESRFIDADNPGAPILIQPRTPKLRYSANHYEGNIFHIYTDKDAPNFKMVTTPVSAPSAANWKDLTQAQDNAYLESFEVLKNFYVIQTRENGLTQIRVKDRKTGKNFAVDFGQETYIADMSMATDEYDTDSIRYSFTSLTTPNAQYMFNLTTGRALLLKQQKVGGNFDAALYETKRVWTTSPDGVKVPISLVYRKDKFKKDGSNPALLYAYGSYGSNSDPYFNSSVISLLDRGFVYAIAHIRGGQELGKQWFEEGRIMKKKNTFIDFVDAAEFLVEEKYTSSDKLFANGGSAGGMLMGAVVNMRPDLFRGVIAEVPWMDVVTDMYNTDLPLTTLEYDQWGDPNKKEHYDYMMSWSPQDNVKPAKYPAIFATGGLNDTQVPYYSPAKWVAKVRDNNLGNNPVLFKVNMGAGHGGESGRFARQKLTAEKFSFMLMLLNSNSNLRPF